MCQKMNCNENNIISQELYHILEHTKITKNINDSKKHGDSNIKFLHVFMKAR